MARAPGVGHLLAGAALREHHRILDASLELQDWTRAEALFQQARRRAAAARAWIHLEYRVCSPCIGHASNAACKSVLLPLPLHAIISLFWLVSPLASKHC
jgi:hypothetical protein